MIIYNLAISVHFLPNRRKITKREPKPSVPYTLEFEFERPSTNPQFIYTLVAPTCLICSYQEPSNVWLLFDDQTLPFRNINLINFVDIFAVLCHHIDK